MPGAPALQKRGPPGLASFLRGRSSLPPHLPSTFPSPGLGRYGIGLVWRGQRTVLSSLNCRLAPDRMASTVGLAGQTQHQNSSSLHTFQLEAGPEGNDGAVGFWAGCLGLEAEVRREGTPAAGWCGEEFMESFMGQALSWVL